MVKVPGGMATLVRRMLRSGAVAGTLMAALAGCADPAAMPNTSGLLGTAGPQQPPPVVAGSAPLAHDVLVFNADNPGNHEIFIMRANGSDIRQLTTDAKYDSWWARIAPDRSKILFYRTPKGTHDLDYAKTSLWLMNADGTQQQEIRPQGMDGWGVQGHAEWSPDGTKLVMFGGSGINPQIFITDAVGRSPQQVTNRGGQNLDPSWSPDGQKIVFVGCPAAICFEKDYEIYTIDVDGENTARLTNNQLRDHDPYYSPDGSMIAWIAEVTPGAFGPVGSWDIFTMAADGSNQRQVLKDNQINSKPHWSLDGNWLYFHRFTPGAGDKWRIFRVRPDGTGLSPLMANFSANAEYPSN